jgi:Protein of unknown function (DUF3047)
VLVAGWLWAATVFGAAAQPLLAPIDGAAAVPSPPWRTALLPQQKLPLTRFDVVDLDGVRALRIESRASYGNLLHPLHTLDTPAPAVPELSWRWRLDRAIDGADLRRKAADDAAAKICVMFDHAIDRVPFVERQMLRVARASTGDALPAATLCYAWDPAQARGAVLPNAYTRRMRWLVLQGAGSPLGAWRSERRDLRADFLRAFGDEASEMPRITAVLVGADADNTGGQGLAHVADLALQ